MKKVLTIAIVALLATATLFAGVTFSGNFTGGYVFNWNKDGDFQAKPYGSDGTDTYDGALNLSVADDNGFWKLGFDYAQKFGAGKAEADFTLNLDKIIAAQMEKDLPVTIALGVGINGRQAGLRAYSNNSGNSFDRIRTAEAGAGNSYESSFVSLTVGYEDLFKVAGAVSPMEINGKRSAVVGALITPVEGIAVSADYVYNGQIHKGVAGAVDAENLFSAAADVDIASLIDANFKLGASVAYAYADTTKATSQVAATVYGGVDAVEGFVEYAVVLTDAKNTNFLEVGADLNVIDNLALNAYFGVGDLEAFEDSYFVGATVGYDLAGIGLELNVEYDTTGKFGYTGVEGFSLTPSVSVSF